MFAKGAVLLVPASVRGPQILTRPALGLAKRDEDVILRLELSADMGPS